MATAGGLPQGKMESKDGMSLPINEHYESVEFLGVWQEEWRARARITSQAERYRIWLRAQGCTRDEAAELAVRFLSSKPNAGPYWFNPPGKPTIH